MILCNDDLVIGRQFAAYAKKTLSWLQWKFSKEEERRYKMYRHLWESKYGERAGRSGHFMDEEHRFAEIEIEDLLNCLPEVQKTIIVLTIIEQFSESYVSERLKLTQQRISQLKILALTTLRNELMEDHNNE